MASPYSSSSTGSTRASTITTLASQQQTASTILNDPQWPPEFPFRDEFFDRYDDTPDTEFYSYPRFVTHIDDAAIAALTDFYAATFPPPSPSLALLDLCSSWISHYPKEYTPTTCGKISGLGMSGEELGRNPQLSDYVVHDLNADPTLPYADNTFDVVTNAVSVDYLTKPLPVFREMHRVLKPGGVAIMSFSNRCFPTKAIAIWTSTGDLDHVWIVGSYFHYSVGGEGGGFTAPEGKEITRVKSGFGGLGGQKGDPMYVVYARKL